MDSRRSIAATACAVALSLLAFPGAAGARIQDSPPSPTQEQLDAAAERAAAWGSEVAFAVADESGEVRGLHVDRTFPSASVVKAMLLVAYLRRPEHRHAPLRKIERKLLSPMIRESANEPAQLLYPLVGDEGLQRLAYRAGMQQFSSSHEAFGWEWGWGASRITAADQARFFLNILDLTPARHRAYVRSLLRSIVWHQRWGIPGAAAGRWTILFKGGWAPSSDETVVVNQVARLEGRRGAVGLAILTDRNLTYEHGSATIGQVAETLLGTAAE